MTEPISNGEANLDPADPFDAEFICAHPEAFSPEMLAAARATLDAADEREEVGPLPAEAS